MTSHDDYDPLENVPTSLLLAELQRRLAAQEISAIPVPLTVTTHIDCPPAYIDYGAQWPPQ